MFNIYVVKFIDSSLSNLLTNSTNSLLSNSNSSNFLYWKTDLCQQFNAGGMPGLNEFASPNFPNKYPPNVDCIRIIQAPSAYDIILRFKKMFEVKYKKIYLKKLIKILD